MQTSITSDTCSYRSKHPRLLLLFWAPTEMLMDREPPSLGVTFCFFSLLTDAFHLTLARAGHLCPPVDHDKRQDSGRQTGASFFPRPAWIRYLTSGCPKPRLICQTTLPFPSARGAHYSLAKLLLQPMPHATTKQSHPSPCQKSSSANNCLKEQLQRVSVRVGALEKGERGAFRMEKSHVVQEGKEKAAHPTQSKVHLHGGTFYSTKNRPKFNIPHAGERLAVGPISPAALSPNNIPQRIFSFDFN